MRLLRTGAWVVGVSFGLAVVILYHFILNPGFYQKNFNPVAEGITEHVYPITYVHATPGCRGVFVAVTRGGDGYWGTEQFRTTGDDYDHGTAAGTIEVVEDADDATMRVVERVERRRDGRPYRRSYVIHVNPLGKAGPECHPGIWTQVDRVDLEKPIRLPKDRAKFPEI
jgi:hypothetical protein